MTKIEYNDYDFITPPKPDMLLPYMICSTSSPAIIPFQANWPNWVFYPVDVRFFIIPTRGCRPREVYHVDIQISRFGCNIYQANQIVSSISHASFT